MNEILKRLAEIKAEAEKLQASSDAGRLDALRALLTEKKELEVQLVEAKEADEALAELTKDVPVAEVADEEKAAEEVVEEAPAEEPADEKVEDAEVEARVPALAAAAHANPVDTDVPAEHDGKPIALIASGNFAGTNPGDTIDARALGRIHRQAGKSDPRNSTIKAIFASMQIADVEGPVLSDHLTADQNTALMASAHKSSIKPITAAAAFCGPDDIVLDICAAGTDARPVQGLFRTVPVRGRFKYMKTATLADVSPGITIWDESEQIALDPSDLDGSTWKPCVDLSCRAETTVTPYAVPACTTIGVWQQLSAPEQIANWLTQMQKQYSRVAETQLLDRIRAQSFVYTAGVGGQGLWTTIQPLLANVVELAAAVNRGTTEGYVILAPYGTLAALAADETMRSNSRNKGIAKIQAELRENYGMTVVEAFETDSTVAPSFRTGVTDLGTKVLGGAGTAFVQGDASPDVWPMYVLNPDSFVAGASDVVDASYYRDGTLVRQNLVRYFWEGMEFLEKTCDHLSFVFELSNCPSGVAPADAEAPTCGEAL